jgi:hypothetical protein
MTLAKFIEPFTPFKEAPDSLVKLLVRLGHALEEDLDDQLACRGFALREMRLRNAAPIAAVPIVMDGFFTFTAAELAFIESLAAQTAVTVTLPAWPGNASARARLLAFGFLEVVAAAPDPAAATVFSAFSLDQEVEQIAECILEHHARGCEFREMGILLRVRDPYAPALEVTLARFGIPARFHFARALTTHPAIQYITGVVRSLLTGWDHADLLTLVRMPINGLGATPEGDRLDFAMRDRLPSAGLPAPLPEFDSIDPWKRERLTPADWAARLKTLRSLIPSPDQTELQVWRSTSAALDAFDTALDIAAMGLDNTKIPLAAFWPNADAAIKNENCWFPTAAATWSMSSMFTKLVIGNSASHSCPALPSAIFLTENVACSNWPPPAPRKKPSSATPASTRKETPCSARFFLKKKERHRAQPAFFPDRRRMIVPCQMRLLGKSNIRRCPPLPSNPSSNVPSNFSPVRL